MKRTLASSIAVLAVLSLASVAGAQSDCTKIVPASPWGPKRSDGGKSRHPRAVTKAAAAEIQTGTVIPMAYNLVDGVPAVWDSFHQDSAHQRRPWCPAPSMAKTS